MKRRTPRLTTVPTSRPPRRPPVPRPTSPVRPKAALKGTAVKTARPPSRSKARRREIGRIIDEGDRSLVDVLDSLLNQGVVLNADLVLALADVDLVYVRLSALLCAADRVLPGKRR